MAAILKSTGFTTLHNPENPELDIVFVHGLQGDPRKTWTYFNRRDEHTVSEEKSKGSSKFWKGIFKSSSRKPATPSDSGSVAAAPANIDADASSTRPDVFWPEDLLPNREECKHARILTYGYDSRLFVLVKNEKVNFSDISSQGETLLNGLARARADCNNRPLMFVAHSLGGLLVKIALNESRKKSTNPTAKDKYDVVNSTFAIVFFGTPHRGASIADLGYKIIRVAGAVTRIHYNPKIIKTLDQNSEILKGLRKDFVDTLDYMIARNKFESSTFQENQGLSSFPGFKGKVVEDDSSELERNDRNDHIEADHMGMCRFSGSDDPGYVMVIGEIERHIGRHLPQTEVEAQGLVSSLEKLGQFAHTRIDTVKKRTEGTLEWLFTVEATSDTNHQHDFSAEDSSMTLTTWLSRGTCNDLFWITGLPGSGKSTIMRHLFESPRTLSLLETPPTSQSSLQPDPSTTDIHPDYDHSIWKRIGLFITNFGGQPLQRKWETMLHGFLLQLLRSRPDLRRLMNRFVSNVEKERRHLGKNIAKAHCDIDWTTFKWSSDLVQRAMEYCIENTGRPLRVLLIVDGLDELEDDDSACEAALFLKNLADHPSTSSAFRICVASRSEKHLLDVFVDAPRIEIHQHTKEDIRQHAWSFLRQNVGFISQPEQEVKASLENLLDYIVRNAEGVFLWAHSIASLASNRLDDGASAEDLRLEMEELPKTMEELYRRLLEQVKPRLRLKAYIILEVVLRLGNPTLETVYHSVQETEFWLRERSGGPNSTRKPFSKDISPKDLQRFRKQLISSCRCMLQFSQNQDKDNKSFSTENPSVSMTRGFVHQRVFLLHASAKEFLLRLDFRGILVAQDGPGKPIGNGHGYYLLYARSWLESMTRPAADKNLDCMNIVLQQAPELNATMTTEDRNVFFEILDDMDDTATSIFGGSWTNCKLHQTVDDDDRTDQIPVPSFLAWAVASGVHEYIVHRISQQENRQEFINKRFGRQNVPPLLFFTSGRLSGQLTSRLRLEFELSPDGIWDDVFRSRRFQFQERTFEYLIEQGVDINAMFDNRTALQYRGWYGWQPSVPMTSFLLKHGADPNISVWMLGKTCPYLHLMVSLVGAKLNQRVEMAAILHKHGVDFSKPDENKLVLAEKLFCASGHFPRASWVWVLESGARITRSMVCSKLSLWSCDIPGEKFAWSVDEVSRRKKDILVPRERAGICDDLGPGRLRHDAWDILRLPEFRRREWYTEEAAELAEEMKPGWFMAEESEQTVATEILQESSTWWNFRLPWRR